MSSTCFVGFVSNKCYTAFTVAHNCHIKTKCSQQITNRSQQIQIAHIKFKSLTTNSIAHSKLQIAHIKFKSLTANSIAHSKLQIAHIKFKSLTANYKSLAANSNRPQQIQIVHCKLKSLTANLNCSHQITNHSARRLRLSTASGTTRLKIFVIHEAATL